MRGGGNGSYVIEGEQYAQEGLKQIGTIGEDSEVQVFTEKSFDGKREDGGRAIRHHKKLGESPCLSSQMGMGGNNVPMFEVKPVLTPEGAEKRQNGIFILMVCFFTISISTIS